MNHSKIIGYHVKTQNGNVGQNTYGETFSHSGLDHQAPIALADAYKRCGAYIAQHPQEPIPEIVPVTRELTPMERTAQELGSLLTSLCKRNGLDLGLSQEQVERQIQKELVELGASK